MKTSKHVLLFPLSFIDVYVMTSINKTNKRAENELAEKRIIYLKRKCFVFI